MRVEGLRNVPFPSIWAQYQAADSGAISELCSLVAWLRSCKVPRFNVGRVHVVPPSSPIVPCYENRRIRPEASFDERIDLVYCPLRTDCHVSHSSFAGVRRMLVELSRGEYPGNTGQLPRSRVDLEPVRR